MPAPACKQQGPARSRAGPSSSRGSTRRPLTARLERHRARGRRGGPAACWSSPRSSRSPVRAAVAAAGADGRHRHAGRPRQRRLQGHGHAAPALRRRRRRDPRARVAAGHRADGQPLQLLGLEGCIAGNKPVDARAPGGAKGPCGRVRRRSPCAWSTAPGTFINSAVDEIQRQLTTQVTATRTRARQAARAARKVAAARGALARRSRRASPSRPPTSSRPSSSATCCRSPCATG